MAAGGPGGLVRVWSTATAREVFGRLTPTQADIYTLAFCGHDGRILAAAVGDNTVLGWFTRSGKPAFSLRGHTQPGGGLQSPMACCLATSSLNRTVKLWAIDRLEDNFDPAAGQRKSKAALLRADGTGARVGTAGRGPENLGARQGGESGSMLRKLPSNEINRNPPARRNPTPTADEDGIVPDSGAPTTESLPSWQTQGGSRPWAFGPHQRASPRQALTPSCVSGMSLPAGVRCLPLGVKAGRFMPSPWAPTGVALPPPASPGG